MIYESQGWAIETAGWAIDEGDESAAFTPADAPDDAALIVSSFRSDHGPIRDEELWEMAGKGSPAAVERTEVRCGAFSGYRACYDEDETHWRVWWLAHGETHLYVTFNCEPTVAGRHDAVVDWMLTSLQVVPYAA